MIFFCIATVFSVADNVHCPSHVPVQPRHVIIQPSSHALLHPVHPKQYVVHVSLHVEAHESPPHTPLQSFTHEVHASLHPLQPVEHPP